MGCLLWIFCIKCITFLTHWGRAMHICIGKLTTIGSDNGLSPGRRQAIIWTNARILLIGPLGTNFSEIVIGIQTFSFKKMSSAKWRPSCLGLNVLMDLHCIRQLFLPTHFQWTYALPIKHTGTRFINQARCNTQRHRRTCQNPNTNDTEDILRNTKTFLLKFLFFTSSVSQSITS